MKRAQIVAMNMHFQRHSFDFFLKTISEMGFSAFEFWAGEPHFCLPLQGRGKAKEIQKKISAYGLCVACLTPEQCLYPYNIASADAEIRAKSVAYFTDYMKVMAIFKTDKILVTSGWGQFDEPEEEGWKRALDSLHQIVKRAEIEGVDVMFETLLPNESNLANSLASTRRILENIQSDRFFLCADTVVVCREGKSLKDYFESFGPRIRHIHLNDGTPTGHLTWGDGTQDLKAHLETLENQSYSGYMTLELGQESYFREPKAHLLRGYEYLLRHMP